MSTFARRPADETGALRVRFNPESPLPLPPLLLQPEIVPSQRAPHRGLFRVGMANVQLDLPRARWTSQSPWRAPERTVRMSHTVSQLLARCDAAGWSFDLLALPAGTLNFYGTEDACGDLMATEEIGRILGALRRARRTIASIVFGVDVWSFPEAGPRHSLPESQLEPLAVWRYLVAADTTGGLFLYQKEFREPAELACLQLGDGTNRVVPLAGRQVRLSLDEEQFEGAPLDRRLRRRDDGADLWINPIHISHPGGGPSPGRWPVGRIETTLRTESCPVFLPHYRRTRLEGPFWFAGHPARARAHRWQPVDQTWFRCGHERVQLLTFDVL